MFWTKIVLFFFVFGVLISNGVSELDAQQRERRKGKKVTLKTKVLTWLLMIILPILLATGIAIRYWPF